MYVYCDVQYLINIFKEHKILFDNYNELLKMHRPQDTTVDFFKVIREEVTKYHVNGSLTYYQLIYDPENFDVICILRCIVNTEHESYINMVHTNVLYRNMKYCQKSLSLFMKYVQPKIVSLYVDKTNIPAIKCYESVGFIIVSEEA